MRGETFSVDASWLPAVPAGSVSTTAPLVSDLTRREKRSSKMRCGKQRGEFLAPMVLPRNSACRDKLLSRK